VCEYNQREQLNDHQTQLRQVVDIQEIEGLDIKDVLRRKRESRRVAEPLNMAQFYWN